MRKLILKETDGNFHLSGFGPEIAGPDGRAQFDLVFEAKGLRMEFPKATAYDLFTTFDPRSAEFLANQFVALSLVRVREEGNETVVEAKTGTLYDFFKDRWVSGHCLIRASRPVAFYWAGSESPKAA
jgi:hypothetical protein